MKTRTKAYLTFAAVAIICFGISLFTNSKIGGLVFMVGVLAAVLPLLDLEMRRRHYW